MEKEYHPCSICRYFINFYINYLAKYLSLNMSSTEHLLNNNNPDGKSGVCLEHLLL